MRAWITITFAIVIAGCSSPGAWGQQDQESEEPAAAVSQNATQNRNAAGPLNEEDRLSLMAAALDTRLRRDSEQDCSHLVHAIYEQAGFPYDYATSDDLYAGVDGFRRVKQPLPGDLIVWRGHAGIVIKPSQHIFFSFLTSGPGTDDYQSRYWKRRGHPRFYRYIKRNPCAGCERRSSELVRIRR
jgi:cell wall-associated NlpC family hydrolase